MLLVASTSSADYFIGAGGGSVDISDDTNLAVSSPIVLTDDTLSLNQNAGTDVTADLEEEVTEGSLANDTILEEDLKAVDTAVDEECLTYESTTGDFEWQSCGGGGSSEWTDSGTVLYPNETTDDVSIGSETLNNSAKLSINGDADQVQLSIQGNANQSTQLLVIENSAGTDLMTLNYDGELTVSGSGKFGGTAQSTFTEGVIVNDGSGADEDDDFIVETDNQANFLEVDAGSDTLRVGDNATNYTQVSATGAITQAGSATLTLQDGSDLIITANPEAGPFISASSDDTSTGTITAAGFIGNLYDASGAVDLDIGSGDILDITLTEDGGVYIFNNGLTASGEDLGSSSAEWNDLYLNDGGIIQFGLDQDVTLTHVHNVGLLLNLELEVDGTLDADGVVALGDGGDNFSVASDGVDIDTSGNFTNVGTIASGNITATGTISASVGFDCVGNVDCDYGSADIDDHTFISDNGTNVVIDGTASTIGTSAIIHNDAMDASSELLAIMDDETGTGVLVFGTSPTFTTSIAIPNGTAPTVDTAGQIAIDTTDDQLIYYGGAKRVIPYEKTICGTKFNLAAGDDNTPFYSPQDNVTVVKAYCHCVGTCTTEADIYFEKHVNGSSTITRLDGTDVVECEDSTTGVSVEDLSDGGTATVTGLDLIRFDVNNTPSPATDEYTICVVYTIDAQ
jgi:hypothetical protein